MKKHAAFHWPSDAFLPLLALLALPGCFSTASIVRQYYILHADPPRMRAAISPLKGLVRVRNLDPEATYDKFQIVVRTSPYEILYRETNVWAVKPNRMISDQIAARLIEQKVFESVTRELGERRPDFVLGGNLNAIELYDSDNVWFAHLALTLSLVDFDTGEILWTYAFDERKVTATQSFSHLARSLSELLSRAIDEAVVSLQQRLGGQDSTPLPPPRIDMPPQPEPLPDPTQELPRFVPEPIGSSQAPNEETP